MSTGIDLLPLAVALLIGIPAFGSCLGIGLATMKFLESSARQPELMASAEDALLGMLDAIIDRAADVLELIGLRLDALGRQVFDDPLPAGSREAARKPAALQEVMRGVGSRA